jgi:hypothetical protein
MNGKDKKCIHNVGHEHWKQGVHWKPNQNWQDNNKSDLKEIRYEDDEQYIAQQMIYYYWLLR